MEHVNALPAGTRLRDYEIEGVLGRGGFGMTYRAVDTYLHKVVAIKEYLPDGFATRTSTRTVVPTSSADRADYEWGLERFLDEARTLARFNHPRLNKVQRYFEAHGTAYLVLEYIEGETLKVVLDRQGRLSEAQVKGLLADVLGGLADVHAAGYVHRDLKPGNLMVQPDGSVVVVDFGAARQAVGQRSKSVTAILTPPYAPLEQYATNAELVGPWSDIYALGMVAYRSIRGIQDAVPDPVTRKLAQEKGEPDLPAAAVVGQGRYDRQLLTAIDWALQVNEKDRPQSVAEWRTALPPLDVWKLEPPPPPRPPEPRPPEPGGSKPERPASWLPLWASVVGIIAVIVAVGAGGHWLGQRATVVVSAPSKPVVEAPQVYPFVVETEPVGATVELPSIEESYRSGLALPVGAYQIEVRAEGYEAQRVWVEHTERGGSYRVALAAARQPFTIVAEPAEARVRIINSPERYAAGMGLPAGAYQVEVSATGYRTVTETVEHGAAPTERRIVLARAGGQPGETFRDCPTCPELVVVPVGSFMMGSLTSEEGRGGNEGPVHRVTIGQPFAVGKYEVTFAEYDRYAMATEQERPADGGWGRGRRPVINVSWEDAVAYVRWLSEQTGQKYRLLSEAEWEYVARAGTTAKYSWGDHIVSLLHANCDGCGGQWDDKQTAPVGSFTSNRWGLHDMHGNVMEWVADCWNANYRGAPTDGSAWTHGNCDLRVGRGGSWNDEPKSLRSAARYNAGRLGGWFNSGGFRIARSLPSAPGPQAPLAERRGGETFRDCPTCPEMVVVPAGSYWMGSPLYEAERADDEGPVHQVTIGQPFAVGVYEVTREEYEQFVQRTRYARGEECRTYEAGEWREGVTWRDPGFGQTERDPVVCVNREDAHAYVGWLSEPAQTGHAYRLLSEAEWEYVARAGTSTPFHTGETISTSQANYNGNHTYEGGSAGQYRERTVPVGSFQPNAFGLYDVHGNVWEWVQDCWNKNYNDAASDGRVWASGDCGRRVRRGGSWNDEPKSLRAAFRSMNTTGIRNNNFGFRVARPLPPASVRTPSALAEPDVAPVPVDPARRAREEAAPRELRTSLGMEFVLIEAGTFQMGSPVTEPGRDYDEILHTVTLSQPYYLGKVEVTQGQWAAVMGDNPSAYDACGATCPVKRVSWEDIQGFIAELNRREGVRSYRLPTEAEWEYAARAGTQTAYHFGNGANRLEQYGWYADNSGYRTHPVGQKRPNAWGLYDMHGNVWEWVADWYGYYPRGAVTDPRGPSTGADRVKRGGSLNFPARYCRAAYRSWDSPGDRNADLGFRLARTP